jgi:pyruvate/2-oxoglutarate dehydrogenase complex dihydrolipoamide dehydrogenase (E3) component
MASAVIASAENESFSREGLHLADWKNPKPADLYHLVIIGAGPAGLLTASEAAQLGAKVALVERNVFGGNCLNTGCVPSKTLIRTSRLYAEMRNADQYGAKTPDNVLVDFPAAMERVRRIRARLAREGSVKDLSAVGVDVFFGEARFTRRDQVAVGGDMLGFEKALIATGARPTIPSIPGLATAGYVTHETIFDLTTRPDRLVVIGGGPTGCELSQAFCRLGSTVTIVQNEPMFLSREERDAAQILSQAFERDGIAIYLNTETVAVRLDGMRKLVDLVREGATTTVVADNIFVGVGETPNVEGLNLEAAGVEYDATAGIRVNDFLATTNPNIYAAGDVCAKRPFTHFEPASSSLVVQNALRSKRKRVSALTIPWCTYTDPEIAHVGMYVREATQQKIPVKTFTVLMHEVHRAICDGEEDGFVKIHVREGSDRILGATVVSRHAGEMINDISLAIQSGIGLAALGRVIRPYPTQAAAIQMAADAFSSGVSGGKWNWKRKRRGG